MAYYASGQLQHHWWGEYHATIVLRFQTREHAAAALACFDAFKQSTDKPEYLYFHGFGADLHRAESQLRAAGADMRKVGSLKYSIDAGEPFTVKCIPTDGSTQGELL